MLHSKSARGQGYDRREGHAEEISAMPQRDSTIFPSSEIGRLFQEPCFIGNKDFALVLNIG